MSTEDDILPINRNSYMRLNEVYFWTTTIHNWYHLLNTDAKKLTIINCLQWLRNTELVLIYGYVIMPNHLHLIWQQLRMNGKELPKHSFEKFTAKTLVRQMQQQQDTQLALYAVDAEDRKYNIWRRDPLAIKVFSRSMALQKLNYIHNNPLQPHWLLCKEPEDYRFSSAAYYECGEDEFNLVTDYRELF